MPAKQFSRSDARPAPLGEARAAAAAGGGTALSTTAALIVLPDGAEQIHLFPRNFATGVVAKVAFNPFLVVLKTQDNLATATDYSKVAQDDDAATDIVLSALDTLANGDFLLIGSHVPFRGVKADVDSANANASVLTVKYWNGSAWTDISATDGTISIGKSMGQDGDVTWTVPSTWTRATLRQIGAPAPPMGLVYSEEPLYWTRWEFSAALSATVTLNSMLSLNRSTAYAELPQNERFDFRTFKGLGGHASIEALMNAGTGNLLVNVFTGLEGRFA